MISRGCSGRDHMVVGFITTYAISAYHHWCYEFESRSGRGVQHCVIKFVSDLWQVSGFLRGPPVSSTNKTDRHNISEILLKVALNTIKQTNNQIYICTVHIFKMKFIFIYFSAIVRSKKSVFKPDWYRRWYWRWNIVWCRTKWQHRYDFKLTLDYGLWVMGI